MIENKPQDYENGVTTDQSAAQKRSFPLRISSVNVTRSAVFLQSLINLLLSNNGTTQGIFPLSKNLLGQTSKF